MFLINTSNPTVADIKIYQEGVLLTNELNNLPTIVWKQDITESFEENKFDFLYTEILTTIGLFMI